MKVKINAKFIYLIIFQFYFLSPILCIDDTISMRKRGCLFMDKLRLNDIIVAFDYNEGYYRAIHSSYGYWTGTSVKMRYLGDSSKDVMMKCYIGTSEDYRNYITSNTLHFYIPCTLENFSVLKEGTYCIEIVSKLIGDITKESFCNNDYTFQVAKSANMPSLTIDRFSEEQIGCIRPGETLTLLGKVENKISVYQSYDYYGIGLSNLEKVEDDIPLQCEIEGNKNAGLYDKITCKIPLSVNNGFYTILYSSSLSRTYQCPSVYINSFNSLNFNGSIKKLSISSLHYINNIKCTLIDITFGNSASNPAIFNLYFRVDNNNFNTAGLTFDNFNNKDVDIKFCAQSGSVVNTKCTFVKASNSEITFYLTCTPDSFEKNTPYSLVFLQDIVLGENKNSLICTYGSTAVYKKIIIPSAEYDFLIIFGDNITPDFDCNYNGYGFIQNKLSMINDKCGWCKEKCILCKSDRCLKCVEGYTLSTFSQCELNKDKINYERFNAILDYYPSEYTCYSNNQGKNLFSFEIGYSVWEGENIAINTEKYLNIIYARNHKGNTYGLNCTVEVNPDYKPFREQNYGVCKNSFCSLIAYVNCSFQENKIANGIYDIVIYSQNDFANLVNRAKERFAPIKIKYVSKQLSVISSNDEFIITLQGEAPYNKKIYICEEDNFLPNQCYILEIINRIYNEDDDETIIECSKEISLYDKGCKSFNNILMENECGNYLREDIYLSICNNYSLYLYLGNLFLILILLLII